MPTFNALPTHANLEQVIFALNNLFGALTLPSSMPAYTVATRPAAASYTGATIYVSDAAAGSKLQYSDGTNWVAAG